jgi:putative copper resistance protein D
MTAAVRFLYTACVSGALGALVALTLAQRDPVIPMMRARQLAMGATALAGVALILSVFVLLAQAQDLRVDLGLDVLGQILGDTRMGQVWLARQALLVMALLLLAALLLRFDATLLRHGALAALLASLAAAPWAGHSAATDAGWTVLPAHALHIVAAGVWLGTLPALLWLLRRQPRRGEHMLSRFSPLALRCMLGIGASGLLLVLVHVQRWPALVATPYGGLLLAKLGLLAAVLALAARLRARLALGLRNRAFDAHSGARLLAVELALALGVLLAATWLGQTVPARHADIEWWLPFRVAVDATWPVPGVPEAVLAWLALAGVGGAVGIWAGRRRSMRSVVAGGTVALVGLGLALRALSVPAYPDTYRTPSVPYHTISVANGAELFARHCVACHGPSAHGDGPLAKTLAIPPGDLTEPHTALHTAGDIFWWLTYGKPPGAMPGFADRLAEDDRWDLVNFVRTLSAGYQARILTERVVPHAPWLPAVDFAFTTPAGRSGTLKDYRRQSALLLVFYTLPASAPRLAQLASAQPALQQAGAQWLAVPLDAAGTCPPQLADCVSDGAVETARTYALLRRTLSNADARDAAPVPAHMELLIDRFGYIRARWLPAEGEGWAKLDLLLAQAAALAAEPEVREPPEDHVH